MRLQSEKGNTLHVTATGSGGLAELSPKFDKGNASFAYVSPPLLHLLLFPCVSQGPRSMTDQSVLRSSKQRYVRVKYANDEESFREKFTLIVWIGEEVKVMRRAKVRFPLSTLLFVLSSFPL